MNRQIEEIRDDELRVIGRTPGSNSGGRPRMWLWIVVAGIILTAVILILGPIFRSNPEIEDVPVVFDQSTVVETTAPTEEEIVPLGNYSDTTGKAYTEHLKQVVNDILLDVYIPHNSTPQLSVGTPDIFDKSIVLVTQAADIRADNGNINGAFVLAGEPLAWGLSKKGYVSIIEGKITIGVADNSPLFEEATEKCGYFFRQYPLVDNGSLVENEPKGKAVRKAICDRAGEVLIVMSETPESFHDFSQALVDLRVTNAVYLVGSDSYGYFRDKYDHFTQISEKRKGGYKYENYIEWR